MTALQQLIYQIATDAEFRRQLQVETISESLTKEKQEALLSLCYLLELSPQDLLQYLTDSGPLIGWQAREDICQLEGSRALINP